MTMQIVSFILSRTFLNRPARDLLLPAEEKNFVVVGAAVGVAVAFRAPMGGVLFVL